MDRSNTNLKTIDRCRICGSRELESVLDMGPQHVASAFIRDVIDESLSKPYPLELVRCAAKKGCGLVQLRHSVHPSILYRDYGYQSGITQLMRINLKAIAQGAESAVSLKRGDTVLDIGCNDGTLLLAYDTQGVDRLGIDPSKNVAALARAKELEVVDAYFSAAAYRTARPGKKARIVTSIAMFYDLEDPCTFAKDIHSILADDGVWIIELSYFPTMLKKRLFDTICHEHLEYYSLEQIDWIMKAAGLCVHRAEFNDVNGGSFRLYIRKTAFGPVPDADASHLDVIRKQEEALRLRDPRVYAGFKQDIENLKTGLRKVLSDLNASKKRVFVYGASTKGNTILQFCDVGPLISKAADRNPDKWGRRTLGTSIPIISEDEARREKPDYFLVLPWHFLSEFIERETAFLTSGGQFIVPLPVLQIVGKDPKTGKILRTAL